MNGAKYKKSVSYNYKTCPYCGQNEIPFKLGVCICGKQVCKIQYVKNSKDFAKNYYSYKMISQRTDNDS